MRTWARSPKAAAVGALALVVLLATWLVLSRPGRSPTTEPSRSGATPSAERHSPEPSPATLEQAVPDPADLCADADDAQVLARPWSPPSPERAVPSSRPQALACPAV
jgi:hypothetical protein